MVKGRIEKTLLGEVTTVWCGLRVSQLNNISVVNYVSANMCGFVAAEAVVVRTHAFLRLHLLLQLLYFNT